jgi:diacylglycerol kinase family enzyme
VPAGSANDFAWSLARQFGPSQLDDQTFSTVDVGLIEIPGAGPRYFVESMGIGLSGMVTIESHKIARLRGVWLYGLAAWRALCKHCVEDVQLQLDDHDPVCLPTLMLSLMVGCREGSFLLAPEARLDDGLFDFVHAGKIGRWEALGLLPRLAFKGPPRGHAEVRLGRCRRLVLSGGQGLAIHADGELLSSPADGVRDLAVQILPTRLRAKVCPLG